MASYCMKGSGDVDEIVALLHKTIMGSGLSVQAVHESSVVMNDVQLRYRVYDKYFHRVNSRVSLSVQIIGFQENIQITAVASGGGTGTIFRFNWGAEDDFAIVVVKPLEKVGFQLVSKEMFVKPKFQ